MQTETLDALQDFVGTLRPAEWLGVAVTFCGVREEIRGELLDAAVHAPMELVLRQDREPRLDLVEPGTRRRREVQVIAWMLGEPALDGGGLVRAVVVKDEMDLEGGRYGRVNGVEELAEFARAMPLMTFGDHLTGRNV